MEAALRGISSVCLVRACRNFLSSRSSFFFYSIGSGKWNPRKEFYDFLHNVNIWRTKCLDWNIFFPHSDEKKKKISENPFPHFKHSRSGSTREKKATKQPTEVNSTKTKKPIFSKFLNPYLPLEMELIFLYASQAVWARGGSWKWIFEFAPSCVRFIFSQIFHTWQRRQQLTLIWCKWIGKKVKFTDFLRYRFSTASLLSDL